MENMAEKLRFAARGAAADEMRPRPSSSTENPRSTSPALRSYSRRQNWYKRIPINAASGAMIPGQLPPSSPARVSSQLVAVLPTLHPIMIPTAWCSCIRPLLTNPTTMTVAALLLWSAAVVLSPHRKPSRGFSVRWVRIFRSLLSAWRSKALPITFIPNRKTARPPSIINRLEMAMP